MKVEDKVVVVTGAASGIGKAMVERFHKEGARGLVVADLNEDAARAVAESVGGLGLRVDVSREAEVARLVKTCEDRFGGIDLFCSNAGVPGRDPDMTDVASASNESWFQAFEVNVMAHVYAARAVLPGMIARKDGYLLNTASAAGLLSQIGSAVYSTTKHAAIGFAESVAIAHKHDGVRVSVLCPQAVDTPMLKGAQGSQNVDGILSPAEVADCVVRGLEAERFLILPHEKVLTYMQRKTGDYDRWIAGMARLRDAVMQG